MTNRGCAKDPKRTNPTYEVMAFSNHAPDFGPHPDDGKVRRVNAYRFRNRFLEKPRDDDTLEQGDLKDRIGRHAMSADFFHAVAPWYKVLCLYNTNIKQSPHVMEDTKVCLLQEGADGEEVELDEDPVRKFVLSKFCACSADDVLSAKEVKNVMKAHFNVKLKDVVVRMEAHGFVLKDSYVHNAKRHVCYRFVDGEPAKPVGQKV